MRFGRGWGLLFALVLLLAAALVLAAVLPALGAKPPGEGEAATLMDLVLDKLGVTQKAEVFAWLASPAPAEDTPDEALPVWTSRSGRHYHSFPLCGGLKSPAQTTLGEATDRGLSPCPDCW